MTAEKIEFKTKTKQILDLVIHSLYSHKEIFLRELISNASDAIDKAKYESLLHKEVLENDKDWKIKLIPDKEAKTLTIRDNGIGLTKKQAIEELGTVAQSGTSEFLEALKKEQGKENPDLIGQFGVGFYSAFMVADKVTVLSRRAGSGDKVGVKWESTADGSFTVDDIEKEGKGTDIVIHLKDEDKGFLEEWELKSIVKKYSDFIEHPVLLDVEKEKESSIDKEKKVKVIEEETINSQKAIWLKSKSDITNAEYNEFYKHISHDYTDPANIVHYRAEGTSEFSALCYIPSKRPFDIFYKEFKTGLTLYVKRVKIIDICEELIPSYLRFVKGVVDSSDLPLNVSRELLQNNRQIEKIKKSITKKILDTLHEMKLKEFDKYLTFYGEFGKILKEGIHFDFSKRETIGELLLFPSTKTEKGKLRSIKEYVEDMKEDQKEIYYITGTDLEESSNSPYLESFKEKGYEVLIMLDEIDDIIMGSFEYKEKKCKSIIKGDIDLSGSDKEEKDKAEKKYKKLINFIKEQLGDSVKDVRLSGRLKDSACCLVADEGGMDPQMEKMLKSMGQAVPESKRILEINAKHPLFEAMDKLYGDIKKRDTVVDYVGLLYNQALLLEGSKPKDSTRFAQTITKLMVSNAG